MVGKIENEDKIYRVISLKVLLKGRLNAHGRLVKNFSKENESFVFTSIRREI